MPLWLLGAIGAVAALYTLVALAITIGARIHAARTPEPPTVADEIREARRARLRRAFPGLLPEDRRHR